MCYKIFIHLDFIFHEQKTMVNKVILIGNVGKDPEVRYVSSGIASCTLSLATSEIYHDKQGNKTTRTEWHRVALWRGLAEFAEKHIRKGTLIYVEGRLSTRNYTDRDGNSHTIAEVIAAEVRLLGNKQN